MRHGHISEWSTVNATIRQRRCALSTSTGALCTSTRSNRRQGASVPQSPPRRIRAAWIGFLQELAIANHRSASKTVPSSRPVPTWPSSPCWPTPRVHTPGQAPWPAGLPGADEIATRARGPLDCGFPQELEVKNLRAAGKAVFIAAGVDLIEVDQLASSTEPRVRAGPLRHIPISPAPAILPSARTDLIYTSDHFQRVQTGDCRRG